MQMIPFDLLVLKSALENSSARETYPTTSSSHPYGPEALAVHALSRRLAVPPQCATQHALVIGSETAIWH